MNATGHPSRALHEMAGFRLLNVAPLALDTHVVEAAPV